MHNFQRYTASLTAAVLLALVTFAAVGDDHGVIATGTFVGQSDHVVTGTVTIKQSADGVIVELGDNFSLDGAPDPKLGFGKDGYDSDTTFTPLQAISGAQRYSVPASIDVDRYDEFYIWCEQFSVPLGVVKLQR